MIRYFWVLRAYALRAGDLTGLGEDIFFLDKAEIVRVLHGETISPKLIKQRRRGVSVVLGAADLSGADPWHLQSLCLGG